LFVGDGKAMYVRMGKRFMRLLKESPHYTNLPCPDFCTFGDCPHTRRADGTSNKADSPKAWFDLETPKHKEKYAQLQVLVQNVILRMREFVHPYIMSIF
jgi:hypothetical protein